MDISISKIRKIALDRPWVHIWYERFIWTYQAVNMKPPSSQQITPDSVISLMRAYLNTVCGLSNVKYYLSVIVATAPDFKPNSAGSTIPPVVTEMYIKFILIVDGGVQLPMLYANPSFLRCNDTISGTNIYPLCYRSTQLSYGSDFYRRLLCCVEDINTLLNQQPTIPTNYTYHKNSGRWIVDLMGNTKFKPTDGFVMGIADPPSVAYGGSYTPQELNGSDYDTCKLFALKVCFTDVPQMTGGYNTPTVFENIPIITDAPGSNGETFQLAQRILNKDFISMRELIRENPLLFIKYGKYLLLLYRYAETKVLTPN